MFNKSNVSSCICLSALRAAADHRKGDTPIIERKCPPNVPASKLFYMFGAYLFRGLDVERPTNVVHFWIRWKPFPI